jgi:hypothetical protein
MNDRERVAFGIILLGGIALHIIAGRYMGLDPRCPRFGVIAVAVIGLRWGSVRAAYAGAFAGFVLAMIAGEGPFAGTLALAAAGWIAGESREWFFIESVRASAVVMVLAVLTEWVLIVLMRETIPPGAGQAALWNMAWAVVFGPITDWGVGRFLTERKSARLPSEPH